MPAKPWLQSRRSCRRPARRCRAAAATEFERLEVVEVRRDFEAHVLERTDVVERVDARARTRARCATPRGRQRRERECLRIELVGGAEELRLAPHDRLLAEPHPEPARRGSRRRRRAPSARTRPGLRVEPGELALVVVRVEVLEIWLDSGGRLRRHEEAVRNRAPAPGVGHLRPQRQRRTSCSAPSRAAARVDLGRWAATDRARRSRSRSRRRCP